MTQETIEAMRHHRDAEVAGKSPDELERLRLLAESLYQAVVDYRPPSHRRWITATASELRSATTNSRVYDFNRRWRSRANRTVCL